MKIVLAGGSGFLGVALAAHLRTRGHDVLTLSRSPRGADQRPWTPDGTTGPWAQALEGIDALVNLAGEGIADKRWSAARKQALRDSRILPTRSLVAAMRTLSRSPQVFVTGTAIGYYGAHDDEPVTEATPPGTDFLSALCVEWEHEAARAQDLARTVMLRTGIVLHPDGGALKSMLPPFRLGVGGPLGSGRQYMPWIHLHDWVRMAAWLVEHDGASGAFNATAPAPVTNAEFTRVLGRVLRRPAFIPVPGFALHIALGEFATFLLTGQRVLPERAEALGFRFEHRELEPALRDLLQ